MSERKAKNALREALASPGLPANGSGHGCHVGTNGAQPQQPFIAMTTLNSRLQLALLNRKKGRNPLEKGFTLVELLVVIIIVGILSSVALPAFLNQAAKAKIASAKSLAGSGSKECQAFLVDNTGAWELTTNGSDGITFPAGSTTDPIEDGACTAATGGTYRALIKDSTEFIATVTASGRVEKSCIVTAAAVTTATEDAGDDGLAYPTTIAGCNFKTATIDNTGTW